MPKALMQKGTDIEESRTDKNTSIDPDFCGATLVKSLPTDQDVQIRITTTGTLSQFDLNTLRRLFGQIFGLATDILSIVRPELGASITAGTRELKIGDEEKSIADWRKSLNARADAADRTLKRVASAFKDRNLGARSTTMRNNTKDLVFSINGSQKISIHKEFRWSVLVPRNETNGLDGHKFDADGVTSETELINSLGTDADTLAKEVDTSYQNVLKQDDKTVMKLCNNLIRSFGAHLQRHDSLALTWLIVRKGALEEDTHSRCFDDDQIAELRSYGITEAPYAGAYGSASTTSE